MRADGADAFFCGRTEALLAGADFVADRRRVRAPPSLVAAGRSWGSSAAATDSSTRPTLAAAEVRLPAACRSAADSPSSSFIPPRYQQATSNAPPSTARPNLAVATTDRRPLRPPSASEEGRVRAAFRHSRKSDRDGALRNRQWSRARRATRNRPRTCHQMRRTRRLTEPRRRRGDEGGGH